MNQGKWIRKSNNGFNIIFIHGINSSESCWKNENGAYWPDLLKNEVTLENIGIYTFSYRTGINTGYYSLSDIVDSLREYFSLDKLFKGKGVIFVCHSMGGIVARRFLVSQYSKLVEEGLYNIGLFLVASPSLGSDYANMLSTISRWIGHTQASALKFSQDNVWLNDLDKDFINLKESERLGIKGKELIEDLPIYLKGFVKKQIVEPFSGARYFGESVKIPGSDHSTIASPSSKDSFQHRILIQFINEFIDKSINLEEPDSTSKTSHESIAKNIYLDVSVMSSNEIAVYKKQNQDGNLIIQSSIPSKNIPEIDLLVQQTREAISNSLRSEYGFIKVLGIPNPIDLTGDKGIYTNVNILDKPIKLMSEHDLRKFRGERLGWKKMECRSGLDVVRDCPHLIVLGKPGSGKTTFLKYLTMQCITGKFATDKVPFFVSLKHFAQDPKSPSLVQYLEKSVLSTQRQPFYDSLSGISTVEIVQQLLQNGRSLVLLDGLDEVPKEYSDRITYEIENTLSTFEQNVFVITYRNATTEYRFGRFTEVEVADFDEQQIAAFAKNWFRSKNDLPKASTFMQRLQKNKSIQELASNPLLLTLLCFVFSDSGEFPIRRAELYEDGVRFLLKEWDAMRGVQRDALYKMLDIRRRKDLLSYVAFATFWRKEISFERRKIEDYINNFLENLKDVDPEICRADSEEILRLIESQHGLLVEIARGVYAFSHLTLHEFFAAREISLINQPTEQIELLAILTRHFSDPQWREVFLLTMELSRNSSDLLLELKKDIDSRVADDHKVTDFLQWVQEKSCSVRTPYKPSLVRAFYYSLALRYKGAPKFEYYLAEKLDSNFDCNKICTDIELDKALNIVLNHVMAKAKTAPHDQLSEVLKLCEDNELKNQFQELYNRLPDKWSTSEQEIRQWRTTDDGQLWEQDLRASMITYRNIGQYLDFTDEQKQLLRQYYDSNLFLWECLNIAYYVDLYVRKNIEETLFLPFKGVEKK